MASQPHEAVGRLHQLELLEFGLVCRLAEDVGNRFVLLLLRTASRFGDWGLSTTAGLLLLLVKGLPAMLLWAATSLGAVALQSLIKRRYGRTRPCHHPGGPPQRASIPDRGSFPSGHTLHAVMAAVVMGVELPIAGLAFIPLALLVATSRVVLGVHYPSDVAAGAAMGALFGSLLCLAL